MEILIIVLGFILDRLSKIWAMKSLSGKDDIVIIKDIFSFSYVENRGAAFGFFQDKVILLSIITLLVLCGIVYFMYKSKAKSKLLNISLSLIVGGALGNLFDRVYNKYVIDFIMFHYKTHVFPNFNVADMMVVTGTGLLAIYLLKDVK